MTKLHLKQCSDYLGNSGKLVTTGIKHCMPCLEKEAAYRL